MQEEEGTIALMLFHWNIHKTLTLGEEQLTTKGFSGIITHKALVTKFLEAQLRTSCRKIRQKANPKKQLQLSCQEVCTGATRTWSFPAMARRAPVIRLCSDGKIARILHQPPPPPPRVFPPGNLHTSSSSQLHGFQHHPRRRQRRRRWHCKPPVPKCGSALG